MNEFQRKNGFSWPLDYRQVISWLLLIYFGLMLFGTLTVSVIQPWSYLIGIVSNLLSFYSKTSYLNILKPLV